MKSQSRPQTSSARGGRAKAMSARKRGGGRRARGGKVRTPCPQRNGGRDPRRIGVPAPVGRQGRQRGRGGVRSLVVTSQQTARGDPTASSMVRTPTATVGGTSRATVVRTGRTSRRRSRERAPH